MNSNSRALGSSTESDVFIALGGGQPAAGQAAAGRSALSAAADTSAPAPLVAEHCLKLGGALLDQGQFELAAAQYQQAIAIQPSLCEAHNNLGCIRRQQGQLAQAQAHFEQVIALAPHLAEGYSNLGNVLKDRGRIAAAASQYERAIALNPGLFQPHHHLGCVRHMQGRLEEAVSCYEQALALKPELAEAQANLASVLVELGQLERALSHFDAALALRPDYAAAHYYRADLKKFRAGDADLAALRVLAADEDQPAEKKLYLHFALAKALEDVGDYGGAFEQLLLANAAKRRGVRYNRRANQQLFRDVAEWFDEELLERFAGVGDPASTPIFVLGMPRSGSTLVEQILASHPQVQAGGELTTLDRALRHVPDAANPLPFPQCLSTLDPDGFRRLGQAYLAGLPPLAEGKTRITDKVPGNFLKLGLIRLMLPNARIIHTVRDPVDTCVSCFSRLFTFGSPFSYDLAELGCYFRWYHELMDHWRSILPADAILDVAYEDVVDDLAGQARRIVNFCGLSWDDRCLSFHETERPIATASKVQVRRPLYQSSVARWRRYEAFLGPLLAELAPIREA